MISIPQQSGPSDSSVWTGWPRCTADDANASQLFCFHAVGGAAMLNTSLRYASIGYTTFSLVRP